MAKEIEQIVCEYRTMFEDVASTVPNIRPNDDVLYSSMNYSKVLKEMCAFLEGYVQYRDKNDTAYDDKIITSTKKYYDAMFSNLDSESPYRQQITLSDMKCVNEAFVSGTQQLKVVMEQMTDKYPDFETQQLATMSKNQYNKLAKVYRDDMQLYLWLATKDRHGRTAKIAPIKNRVDFMDVNTPVIHRLDQYQK